MAAYTAHGKLMSKSSPLGSLPLEVWCGVMESLCGDLDAIRTLACLNKVFNRTVERMLWPTIRELVIVEGRDALWSVNNVVGLDGPSLLRFLRRSVLPNADQVESLIFDSELETFSDGHLDFFLSTRYISTPEILQLFCSKNDNGLVDVLSLTFGKGFCDPRLVARLIRQFSASLRSVQLSPRSVENALLETSEEFWNALPACPNLQQFHLNSCTFPIAFGHLAAAILAEPSALTLPDAECIIEDFEPYEDALMEFGKVKKLSLLERETSPGQVFMTWVSDESWNTTLFELLPKILLTRLQQNQGNNAPAPLQIPRALQVLEISPDFKGDLYDWFTLFSDLKILRLLKSVQNSPYGVDEQGVRRLLSHSINKYLMVHKGGGPERKTLKVYGLQHWHRISNINPDTDYATLLQHMLSTFPTYFGPEAARNMIRKVPSSADWENEAGPLYICEDSNIFIEMYW